MEAKVPKPSNISLVGGSKKLTLVYWMTPIIAACTFLFGYFEISEFYVEQFWVGIQLLYGGYLGVQGFGDIVERGVNAYSNGRKLREAVEKTTKEKPNEAS